MKQNGSRYGGFTLLEVLLCLTALPVAVAMLVKWYVFSSRQHLTLRKQQCLVYCVDAFLFWIREQPNMKSCAGTWYAYRKQKGSNKKEAFSFVREQSGLYDFKVCVENSAWSVEKSPNLYIAPQSASVTDISESSPSKDAPSERSEFLAIRFYTYGKKYCLHTFFLPVTSKKLKEEEQSVVPGERFMLMPESKPSVEKNGK